MIRKLNTASVSSGMKKGKPRRLYGFLYHPKPKTNKAFPICVLAYYDSKNDESTDRTLLKRAMGLRENPLVQAAIAKIFPGKMEPKKELVQ